MATTQKKTTTRKAPAKTSSKAPAKRTATAPPPRPSFAPIVAGILCLLLALCTIASYFGTEAIFLNIFSKLLKGLFGNGYFLCAAALIWAGVLLLRKNKAHLVLRLFCTALLPFVFGAVFHLLLCKEPFAFALADIKALWAAGIALTAGGVLSGSAAAGMIALLGNAVSLVVLLITFIMLLLGALPLTPKELWQKYCDYQESRYEEEEEPPFDDGQFMAPPVEAKPIKKRSRTLIDIPLDEDEPNELVKPFTKEKKTLLKPKEEAVLTPAQALDPAVKVEVPTDIPAPVEEKKPASRKARAAAEVKVATEEVSAAIEKELSEEEPTYSYPPITLLDVNTSSNAAEVGTELRLNAQRLANTLVSFGVDAKPGEVIHGPSVTRYEFTLDSGVKLSKLTNLSDDIALALGASGVRIAPIPGKISVVGIEVPNKAVTAVRIRDVLESGTFVNHSSTTAFAVGKDIGGNHIVGNIARLPHVLIAGTTGSGKSVCTNSLIVSLLYKSTPDEVRFIMVDPKMVELAPYNGIPHLLIPVVTDPKKAAGALQWAVFEMMKRYKMFSEKGVKDLAGYNALCDNPMTAEDGMKKLPTVVVVIDELADLMLVAAKEVEESICRVAQMGRAAGMHLVIATQRPSADVITGLMKANIPSRIAFAVASSLESRIILDTTGAEKLVGKGDMLYFPLGDGKPTRVQGCFITPEEIDRVVSFVKESGEVHYDQTVMDKIEEALKKDEKGSGGGAKAEPTADDGADELLSAAVEVVLETGQASVSMLQRRLKLGYSRAARLVDQMEERGFVGPFEGSKPRQLLITREQWQELQMKGAAAAPADEPAPIDRYGSIRDTFESRDALE